MPAQRDGDIVELPPGLGRSGLGWVMIATLAGILVHAVTAEPRALTDPSGPVVHVISSRMLDDAVGAMAAVMGSPWIYLVLLVFSAIGGFVPGVPSKSLVITAGAFSAANGEPNLVLIVLVAALGGVIGDSVSYMIGRFGGDRLFSRASEGATSRQAATWAARMLALHGGRILVTARHVPGGRLATTLTCGITGYGMRAFFVFDSIAALSWGGFAGLVGYVGGRAFVDAPVRGLLAGFGIAIGITVVAAVVRWTQGAPKAGGSAVSAMPSITAAPRSSELPSPPSTGGRGAAARPPT